MSKSKKITILIIVFVLTLIIASFSGDMIDDYLEKKASSYHYDYFSTIVLDKKVVHYVDDPSDYYVLISDPIYTDGEEVWVEYDFPSNIGDTIMLYHYNGKFYTSIRSFVSPFLTAFSFFVLAVPMIITIYFLFFKKKKTQNKQ